MKNLGYFLQYEHRGYPKSFNYELVNGGLIILKETLNLSV